MTDDEAFLEVLLRDGSNSLWSSLSKSGIGLWVWDIATDEITLSKGMLAIVGMAEQATVNRSEMMTRWMSSDEIEFTTNLVIAHWEEGKPYVREWAIRHVHGHLVPCITRAVTEFDDSGQPVRMIGTVRSQDELERTKSHLHRAEEIAQLGYWHFDVQSDVLFWSPGVYKLHKLERNSFQLTRKFARDRYHEEDRELVEKQISESLETGLSFDYRTRIIDALGEIRHVHVMGEVELGVDNSAISYFGIVQDITDEVQREAQLLQAQKMEAIGNISGGMAHDFNNLLAVILGNLELLLDDIEDVDQRSLVDSGITAALRGAELTRNMLSFARQAPLEPSVLDLNEIAAQSNDWIGRTLPANLDVRLRLASDLWKIDADKGSLENAVLNLVLNARDAMQDGGVLTIETENVVIDEVSINDVSINSGNEEVSPGNYAVLAISDTGHGISPELNTKIFDPFFSTKAPGKGSGLGLSMIQGFMKQSGGAVRVYSEPDAGTTFRLFFQAGTANESDAQTKVTESSQATSEGVRILLVEDEVAVADVLTSALRNAGYKIHVARNGEDALEIFAGDPTFDLLLTDVVMPGKLQGTHLSRELRAICPSLPVILMTGYASEATVHGDGHRPEDVRLMKPVRRSDLIAAIESLIVSNR